MVLPLDTLCPKNGWCTYEAVDDMSIKIEITLLVAFVLAGLFILRYFTIILKYRRKSEQWRNVFGEVFIQVYIIVLIWVACSFIKVSLNIIAYHQYIGQDFNSFPKPSAQSGVFVLSMLFNSFDNGATFFLVYAIIFIPCHWLQIILSGAKESQSSEISFRSRKLYSLVFQAVKVIKIYLKIRLILLLICFLEPVIAITIQNGCQLTGHIVLYRICQASLIFLLYILGFAVVLNMNKTHLIKIDKKDFKQLRLQYILLMISLLTRIFMNVVFKVFAEEMLSYTPETNCFDQNRSNDIQRSVILLVAEVIMHFMPMAVVIYIYRPNLRQRQKEISLRSDLEEINVDDENIDYSSGKIQEKQSIGVGLLSSKS